MYVCLCHCVRDGDLRRAAESGVRSFEELQARTQVSTCCGRCETTAREIFALALDPAARAGQPA